MGDIETVRLLRSRLIRALDKISGSKYPDVDLGESDWRMGMEWILSSNYGAWR
jgi:hypothetical protein